MTNSSPSIKQILIDCDGVLTDGCLTIDRNGEKLFKRFHTKDVRAIRELIYNGYEVTIVSADDWEGVQHFADKVGAEFHYKKEKNGWPKGAYIAVGDDAWDILLLKDAIMAFCPADADESVKGIENIIVLETIGGKGVIAEIARRLLS